MDKIHIVAEGDLPKDRTYVLAKHLVKTWIDKDDQAGVSWIVVKFIRGLSLADREKLADDDERKRIWKPEDEGNGNNRVPYLWKPFGSGEFFGHAIECWTSLPD